MDEGKKTTVYLPEELAAALRALAFQMHTTVSDLLTVAAEERYRRCIAEGAGSIFGPKEPSEEWRAIKEVLAERRVERLLTRRAERKEKELSEAQLADALENEALRP